MKTIKIKQILTTQLLKASIKIKVAILSITLLLTAINYSYGQNSGLQNLGELDSYILAKNLNGEVYLYQLDINNMNWIELGNTNRTDIQALSIHPSTSIMYAVSNGELGTLSYQTGAFATIGSIGNGNGNYGNLVLDNIYGLTCSYTENAIYATHRIDGFTSDADDVLLKIDLETGSIIPDSFKDLNNSDVDYAVIPNIFFDGFSPNAGDIVDISIDPFTNKMYTIHTNGIKSGTTLINIQNAALLQVIVSYNYLIEGFSFNNLGTNDEYFTNMYAISSANFEAPNNSIQSSLLYLDSYGFEDNFGSPLEDLYVLDIDFAKSPCQPDLLIKENYSTGLQVYPFQNSSGLLITETTTSENLDVRIDDGQVEFKAGHITLQRGFSVFADACFSATIDPCN